MASGTGHASGERRPSIASAAAYTYATNLAVAVLSLVNVMIVARYLGPVGRGDVAFLTAVTGLLAALFTMGVEESNANLVGSRPAVRPRLATNSVVLGLALGLLGGLSASALIAVFPGVAGSSSPELRKVALASLGPIVVGTYLRYFIRSAYGFTITNVAWLLVPVVNVAVNGLFALVGVLTVASAVSTWIAGQVLATLVLAWWVAARMEGFGAPSIALMRETLGFGLRSHAGRITLLGNYRLDQWILGAVSGSRELGLYSVAVAWAEALWYLPTALGHVQRADLVRVTARRAAELAAVGFRVATWITGLLAVAMLVAAPQLCTWAFGPEFEDSVGLLRVLTLGAFGVTALKLFGTALVAQGAPVRSSVALSTAFAVTLALDVLLIPPFGGMGAAIASTVAYTVAGGLMAWLFVTALGGRAIDLVPRAADTAHLLRAYRRLRVRMMAAGDERRAAKR